MLPTYDADTVVVVYRDKGIATTSLLGEVAAILTADGKRYLKRLMPGPKPHLFTLESLNARPIVGVRISWASEIVAIIPARQVRHIAKTKPLKPVSRSQRGGAK
jgi:repressor LexA